MSASAVLPATSASRRAGREAKNGTLILGGGFGGAHVARLLGAAGATIVDPEGRHALHPAPPRGGGRSRRTQTRHRAPADDVPPCRAGTRKGGRPGRGEPERRGKTELGRWRSATSAWSSRSARPLGCSPSRDSPSTPSPSRVSAMPSICATTSSGSSRRQRPTRPTRRATSPSSSWGPATPAWRHSPRRGSSSRTPCDTSRNCDTLPQRWVLVEAGPEILAEVPEKLADYTATHLRRQGVEILSSSTLRSWTQSRSPSRMVAASRPRRSCGQPG